MSESPDLREQEDCPSGEACRWACDQHPYRPRVRFTHGSIAKVVTARRRYRCQNHLTGVPEHFIEPGQQYVRNSLPPFNSEIGNEQWWWLRVCLDCCPAQYDPRLRSGGSDD